MIQVVMWKTEGTDQHSVYRLDVPGEGDRLFRDLKNNAETDGRETLMLGAVSEAEWAEAEKLGAESA